VLNPIVIKLDRDEEEQAEQPSKGGESSARDESKSLVVPNGIDDQLLLAFAPNPTSVPHEVLPRYLMMVRLAEEKDPYAIFRSYFEGKLLNLPPHQSSSFLAPTFNAPLGYSLWLASPSRKISILSQSEYMAQQEGFTQKTYSFEHLPLEKGKYTLLCRYNFIVQAEDTLVFNVDMPNDRFLLNSMRIVIDGDQVINQMRTQPLKFSEGKHTFLLEGAMPYNTTEGQV